jgi:hypothetical protein
MALRSTTIKKDQSYHENPCVAICFFELENETAGWCNRQVSYL